MTYPKLVIVRDPIRTVVRNLMDRQTILIADEYNYPRLHDLGTTVLAVDPDIDLIDGVDKKHTYTKVVAVGGCTALDVGRACASKQHVHMISVPSILSNSCLSTNRSVIKHSDGSYRGYETVAPSETIICLPSMVAHHRGKGRKWAISGLGDLFAAVSASIEFEYKEHSKTLSGISTSKILNNIPICSSAMQWVMDTPMKFDEPVLKTLVVYLHEASLEVIRLGHVRLNAASEHQLFYAMQERQHYDKTLTTHGRLVSVGTLITCKIFAEATGEDELYKQMRNVYKKLRLPLSYDDLDAIEVKKEALIQGIEDIRSIRGKDCLYTDYFKDKDYSILDRIFAASPHERG